MLHETEVILAAIKANTALLEQCVGPHIFCICLDRHTKEPIAGKPTPAQRFGAWWRCCKCGGQVENLNKIWYENGVQHGRMDMAWQIHKSAKPAPSSPVNNTTLYDKHPEWDISLERRLQECMEDRDKYKAQLDQILMRNPYDTRP